MANPFYNASGNPGTGSEGLSSLMRGEFLAIQTAFDLMPRISTTGLFDTIFNQQGSYTFTLPGAPGTLAMLSDVAVETTARAAAVAAETGRALAAEGANTTAIGAEVTARTSAVTSEATARNAAIAAEATIARANENTLSTNVTANATAISTETVNRLAAAAGYLSGLGLSWVSNTALGVSAGTCTDTTGQFTIKLASTINKSISGAWVAGSGNNGMGTGLTATLSTWYHVFAGIISGVADAFFDTSATATHAPAGTTAFRHIGWIKLDAAVHIIKFVQNGDRFDQDQPIVEYNATVGSIAQVIVPLLGAPPNSIALLSGSIIESTAGPGSLYLSSLAQTDISAGLTSGCTSVSANGTWSPVSASISADGTSQIRLRSSTTTMVIRVLTNGWIDTRGRG